MIYEKKKHFFAPACTIEPMEERKKWYTEKERKGEKKNEDELKKMTGVYVYYKLRSMRRNRIFISLLNDHRQQLFNNKQESTARSELNTLSKPVGIDGIGVAETYSATESDQVATRNGWDSSIW